MTQRSMDDIGSAKDLAKYRIDVAKETLQSAERALSTEDYRTANNRAYYAIFYAISACLALEFKAFKSHAQTLGAFNKDFIHAGIFTREFSRKISNAQHVRESSDYDDFYVISIEETRQQVESATEIVATVEKYISKVLSDTE